MLDFSSVVGLQGTLFLMMLMGTAAAKAKLISAESRKGLSNILIYLISPCNIIASFRQQVTMSLLRQSMLVLAISFGLQVFYLCIN
ncbi:MAG: AEC family transporter, partial [Anaerotignum sp.]